MQLGVTFPVRLEGQHVVDMKRQVWAGILGLDAHGAPLQVRASAKRDSDDESFSCQIVSGGGHPGARTWGASARQSAWTITLVVCCLTMDKIGSGRASWGWTNTARCCRASQGISQGSSTSTSHRIAMDSCTVRLATWPPINTRLSASRNEKTTADKMLRQPSGVIQLDAAGSILCVTPHLA